MELLKEILLPKSSLPKLIKVRDLIYFDGPLLSHFQSSFGENYLFYWVDADNKFNRWLVFRTSYNHIDLYLEKRKTLYELISNIENGSLYKIDIDDELVYNNLSLIEFEDIPESYLPEKNSYYNFKIRSSSETLKDISKKENTGVLQAYYNETSKIGRGYIDLEILGSSLNDFSQINKGIRKAFIQKEKTNFNKAKLKGLRNAASKFDETEIIKASSFYYFGNTAASFGALFKAVSSQTNFPTFVSLEDRYVEFLIGFFKNSADKTLFTESIRAIDKSVIDNYKKLLSIISKSKIQFNINYYNVSSNFNISKNIDFTEAKKILSIIDDLEFDESHDIYLTGRFTALNLKTGHYNFETVSENSEIIETSYGYLDSDRREMSWQIKWDKLYDVIITRKETRKTGRRKTKTIDVLVSFVEIDKEFPLSN